MVNNILKLEKISLKVKLTLFTDRDCSSLKINHLNLPQ
jgi:hypothetical protein